MKVQTSFGLFIFDSFFSYQGGWWVLVPISAILYAVFGLGVFIYFFVMIIQRRRNPNDPYFQLRFRFVLLKFKTSKFYWKIAET
jgi:hypothetical protein